MGLRVVYTIGAMLLVATIQFIAGLNGNRASILLCGALMGAVPFALLRLHDASANGWKDLLLPALAAGCGIVLGGGMHWLMPLAADVRETAPSLSPGENMMALFPGLMVSAAIISLRRLQHADLCHCCQRRLGNGRCLCPRGEHWVCSNCWSTESHRCRDCERLRTPLLVLETADWWDEKLGKRQTHGRCARCNGPAADADLRACGRCPRANCTRCWDMENGRCTGCSWVMPDLPTSLAVYHSE